MDPATLSALMQAPNFLQGVASLFTQHRDPMEELGRYLDQMRSRFGPQQFQNDAMGMYRFLLGSPMGIGGMNNILSGAAQGQNILNRSLAATGAAGAGVNQIRKSLYPSVVGSNVNAFRSGIFNQGAQNLIPLYGMMAGGAGDALRFGQRDYTNTSNLMNFLGGVGKTNWQPFIDFYNRWRAGRRGGYAPNAPQDPSTPSF